MSDNKPNLLVLVTDQQSASMMSCAGNSWLKTPNMDRLAEKGVRFTRAYCAQPVCLPSRYSMMTGTFPSSNGIRCNVTSKNAIVDETLLSESIGPCVKRGGYDIAYGGKVHLPKGLSPEAMGFENISADQRDDLAVASAEFIRRKHDKPWFLNVHLINPHDICLMAIRDSQATDHERRLVEVCKKDIETLDEALKLPDGVNEDDFWQDNYPPLPSNHHPQEDEPEAVKFMLEQRPFRGNARNNYTDKDWRRHRYAYHRLTEFVDTQLGVILDALDDTQQWDNTVIMFTSDHGDHSSAHKLEHKTIPYEEAANIPFILVDPSQKGGRVDESSFVNNGLDILPTVCEYAGVEIPASKSGLSLKQLAEANTNGWRDIVGVETEIGDAIVTERYKYVRFFREGNEEQLYDLQKDPGETRNAKNDPEHQDALAKHRELFDAYFPNSCAGEARPAAFL